MIDLDSIYRDALAGVHRAYVFMRFGNRGVDITDFEETRLPGYLQIMVVPEPMPEDQLKDYASQYKAWTLGNGLRELVETFCHFLDEIYGIGLTLASPADVAKKIKAFEQASLRDKVQRLRDEFQIEGVFARHFETFTAVRNALAHGMGLVRARDCNDDGELLITWRGVELKKEPSAADSRALLDIERPTREKRWKVGERVALSAHEMAEICFMANYEAVDVTDALCEFALKRGISLKQVEIIRGG